LLEHISKSEDIMLTQAPAFTSPKIVVKPTESKRLAGIKDIGRGLIYSTLDWIAGIIRSLASGIFNYPQNFNAQTNRVNASPRKLTRSFTAADQRFTEKAKVIDCSIAGKYLTLNGKTYEAEIIKTNKGGIRPSSSRTVRSAQGMMTNGWVHTLYDKNGKVIDFEFRSGAFAVHNRNIGDPKDLLTLSIAQALPKVVASVKKIACDPAAKNAAARTGRFLHAETSLLSDEFEEDRPLIKSMEKALKHLSHNLVIRFQQDAEETISIGPDTQITVTLPSPKELNGAEFRTEILFFTQGVNARQSKAHAFSLSKRKSLQDKINKKNLKRLISYAEGRPNQAIIRLSEHYGPRGRRKAKDLAGLKLVREAVKSLGGGTGTVCKSGKDRTGMKVCLNLSESASEQTGANQRQMFEELIRGISLAITGYNTGQPPAYAFKKRLLAALPKALRPPSGLCGKTAS
jgi:hypothetical protein